MPGAQCALTPANPVTISANAAAVLTVTLNAPNNAPPAAYNINLTVADSSGQPSQTVQLPLTVITDFSISSATSTQTVTAGQTSGAYQLAIAPNPPGASFNAAVTLACTAGLPAQAQCIFTPSPPTTPGNSAVDVVMNVSTATTSNADVRRQTRTARIEPSTTQTSSISRSALLGVPVYVPWLLLPGIVIGCGMAGARHGAKSRQRRLGWFTLLASLTFSLFLFLLLSLPSCGGVSNGGGSGTTGTPTTYVITVTGTSGSLSHSTQLTLVVD
jgi:hypothetical protein